MDWPSVEDIESTVRTPQGYHLDLLNPDDLDFFIGALEVWYPDIHVGSESRFLNLEFYKECVFLADNPPCKRYYLPIIFKHRQSGELAGCVFLEKNDSSLTITSPMGAIAINHRHTGTGLSFLPSTLITEVGRMLGFELAYYISTLRSRANQIIAEKTGYKLVGIIPGNDRDMVSPGISKRVFEAFYAKLLLTNPDLYVPTEDTLTETTRNLWSVLFPSIRLRREATPP